MGIQLSDIQVEIKRLTDETSGLRGEVLNGSVFDLQAPNSIERAVAGRKCGERGRISRRKVETVLAG